jgi:hypothetical protein
MNHYKSLVSALAAVCMILTSSLAGAEQYSDVKPTGEAIAGDALLVRPIGLAATVLGLGIFIVSLPFTIPSGSVGTAAKALIGEPAQYTFARPIGQSQAKPIEDVQRQ